MSHTLRVFRIVLAGFALGSGMASGQDDAGPDPRLWTVLVSIEGYRAPIPPRPGQITEGRRLARWVTEKAGWGPDHVLELIDIGDPRPGRPEDRATPLRPTRENLDWAMEKWLGARVRKGDVVVLAFAGRGATVAEGEVLLPIDAGAGEPGFGGWSPERGIDRLLADLKCSAVLCWIDAPPSGLNAVAGRDPGSLAAGDRLLNRLTRWPGSSAWMATGERSPGTGPSFAASLRAALGEKPGTLLASLAKLDGDPKLRGLEFRRRGGLPPDLNLFRGSLKLPRKSKAELLIQKGHADRVTALAIQGDGGSMFSASSDSTLRVWGPDRRERALLRVLPEFLNGVTAMALGAGGRYLTAGDGMGKVLAWDLNDPEAGPMEIRPKAHTDTIKALAFLPDDVPQAGGRPGVEPPTAARFVSLGQDGRCESWSIVGTSMRRQSINLPRVAGLRLAAASRPGGAAFAILDDRNQIRAFDRDSRPFRLPVSVPGGRPTALHLDPEGKWAAVGDDSGRVRVVELATGAFALERDFEGAISAIRIGPGKLLAVGASGGLSIGVFDRPGDMARLEGPDGPAESIEFSPDGGWLGICTRSGGLFAWKVEEGRPPLAVKLDRSGGDDHATCLAFGPPSGPPLLAVGEDDGGIRRWDLKTFREYPRLDPHRGKIRRLGATPDGRYLLQITEDDAAQVWDLQQGRNVRTLAGLWSTGAFLPDGRLALARHPNEGGGLVLVDPRDGRPVEGVPLAHPDPPVDGGASGGDYGLVVTSRDGRWVAAASAAGRSEVVHVWDLREGRARSLGPHADPVTALDFSADGRTLLTASKDHSVKLWDLADGAAKAPIARFQADRMAEVSAASLSPSGVRRVAAAGPIDGELSLVVYWDAGAGQDGARAKPVILGEVPGRVRVVTFLAGGRFVAAAGDDRRLHLWELAEGPSPARPPVVVEPLRPLTGSAFHHTESVKDLLAWPRPEGPILASGGDDTTVRFWRIKPSTAKERPSYQLLGTLSSAPDEAGDPARPGRIADFLSDAPWVAFTPDGVYDGSLDGDRLVSFGDGRDVSPLNQFAERLFHPFLTDRIRRGVETPPRSFTPPPTLLIQGPEDQGPAEPEAEVRVSLRDPSLKADDLRLYQNDVPVRDGDGFRQTDARGEFVAQVRLVRGDNRFYAMAGRPNDADARSGDLTLFHAGPDNPGRVHVVSLGVGKYGRNALRYPVADANEMAAYLRDHGVGAGKKAGRKILLADARVDRKAVDEAFTTIRNEVKGHPEDTVVVFLAGHTDIITDPAGQSRYSLLLAGYPFPADAPAQAILRGPGVAFQAAAPAGTFLPYSAIYRNLISLDALQRLVIVDACQAEAIQDDGGVRVLDQLRAMDLDARRTRTDYLLASRRGEAAVEAPVLKHGLLTYVLLRGMGAAGLEPAPIDVPVFREHPSADVDGDGKVTTRELRRYVDLTLPELASRLSGVPRGDVIGAPRPAPPRPAPRLLASGTSFPLVELPPTPATGGGSP